MLAPPPHRRVSLHLHYVLLGISDVHTRIGLHGRLPAIILHPTPSHFLHCTGYSAGTCVQCIMNAVPQHSEGPYSEQRWVWGSGFGADDTAGLADIMTQLYLSILLDMHTHLFNQKHITLHYCHVSDNHMYEVCTVFTDYRLSVEVRTRYHCILVLSQLLPQVLLLL